MEQMTKTNMLWIFALAFIMSISLSVACSGNCDGNGDCCKPPSNSPPSPNLAAVTWAHAVNSKALLDATIKNDGIKMIEADVVMGTIVLQPPTSKPETSTIPAEVQKKSDAATGNEPAKDAVTDKPIQKIPIMSHPPSETSDLSFIEFVNTVAVHNSKASEKKSKGVKLDFKTTDALKSALPLIKETKFNLSPIWINADILVGPGSPTTQAVDAKAFFEAVKAEVGLNKATLSIGWTTNVVDNAKYDDDNVNQMIKTIEDNMKSEEEKLHPITFPVRAALAAQSKDALAKLVTEVEKMNITTTLTIWSADNDKDKIDVKKLREVINQIGLQKVYIDVDNKLKEELIADSKNGASSLVNFGLLNVATFLFALFLRNGFY